MCFEPGLVWVDQDLNSSLPKHNKHDNRLKQYIAYHNHCP